MVPVVYTDYMVGEVESFSPSAGKPKLVTYYWLAEKKPIFIEEGRAATLGELYTAHSKYYVDGVLNGDIPNGFGTRSKQVAKSCTYTVGGLLTAMDLVAIGYKAVCVPVSGFHHAGYASAGGYCTFNGLVVAAEAFHGKVAIIDCDMHYGDGTEEILSRVGSTDLHFSFGEFFSKPSQGDKYLLRLQELFDSTELSGVDLILYQAGADVHVDDPLGGALTTAQMQERDKIVFGEARRADIPVIWCLAGGYQTPVSNVIDLHTNTLDECLKVFT